ncbi:MAG: hypothetical protein C5B50_12565 [Verrucomicrobia bacterium]|nr:MAG: hypothetical protein C5B50_12565 [Verrucomicrobiota bacterium]
MNPRPVVLVIALWLIAWNIFAAPSNESLPAQRDEAAHAPVLIASVSFNALARQQIAHPFPSLGAASWYGEDHRGRLMANGKKFNPDRFTAASWFYPLGTRVRVTLQTAGQPARSVRVTITDRGPAHELVREGRIIDLARAPFKRLAPPDLGLVPVKLEIIE